MHIFTFVANFMIVYQTNVSYENLKYVMNVSNWSLLWKLFLTLRLVAFYEL